MKQIKNVSWLEKLAPSSIRFLGLLTIGCTLLLGKGFAAGSLGISVGNGFYGTIENVGNVAVVDMYIFESSNPKTQWGLYTGFTLIQNKRLSGTNGFDIPFAIAVGIDIKKIQVQFATGGIFSEDLMIYFTTLGSIGYIFHPNWVIKLRGNFITRQPVQFTLAMMLELRLRWGRQIRYIR